MHPDATWFVCYASRYGLGLLWPLMRFFGVNGPYYAGKLVSGGGEETSRYGGCMWGFMVDGTSRSMSFWF
jgi:hypothetical protein